MKALVAYIVSGRLQAILTATASGVLAFLLPPWSTLLIYIGAAALSLVVLRIGPLQGLQVLAAATALTALFYQLAGVPAVAIAVTLLMLWLPCWIASGVLWRTASLALAMLGAAALGIVALLLVYVLYGDPAPWWLERFQQFMANLEEIGLLAQGTPDKELLQDLSRLMTGVVLASLVLSALCSLLLGRWWQALLVNPGGLRTEFNELRLGQAVGLLTLGGMLVTRFAPEVVGDITAQSVMIMLVPYLFTGLAVLHGLVARAGRGRGWLIAVYVLLAILPQAMLLLAGLGLLDTWIDFRRRFGGSGGKPAV
jgi:hypothetical protein